MITNVEHMPSGVENEGVGAALSESQLGLLGMRERAHLVGGSMTVESSRGVGTTIGVTVPLPTAGAGPRQATS